MVDQRTDVYSLGITLYELLTLRPAFEGEDRQQLLKQIAFDDPALLRKVNREIPAELETIIEKAIRKNPAERYATAKDLADDLRNLLADRTIKAKPPTWREKLFKYSRRHPAGVRASLLALFIAVIAIAASMGWVMRDCANRHSAFKFEYDGEVSASFGRYTQAEDAFREAIRLQPDDIVAYHKLAVVLSQQNQLPGAIAVLREAIRRNPSDDQSHGWLGESLVKQAELSGQTPPWDEAAAEYARAIELSKDDYNGLGLNFVTYLSRWDEVFDRVARKLPDDPRIWIGHGRQRRDAKSVARGSGRFS